MNITKQSDNNEEPPKQRMRGLRSLIKKSSSADHKRIHHTTVPQSLMIKYDSSIQNEEVSFDITQDDEDILNSIYNSNHIVNDSYEEEKPFDGLAITKIEKDESTINTINTSQNPINHTTITTLSNSKSNGLNSINNRLLQKIKQVKALEQELKEKNVLIERLKSKIKTVSSKEKDNMNTSNPKIKNELALSHKKLKEKEEELAQKKKVLDNLVESYKEKINNLINTNEISLEKIDKLENKIKVYKENENKFVTIKDNYEKKILSLEKQIKNLNENFEKSIIEKQKLDDKNKEYKILLNNALSVLLSIRDRSQNKISKQKETHNKIVEMLKLFFSDTHDDDETIPNEEIK